jgi:predicted N-acetyltransferase YhbS
VGVIRISHRGLLTVSGPTVRALCHANLISAVTNKLSLVADDGANDAEVEALYARAFGPGRFAKAAARLREGNHYLRDKSFVAVDEHSVVGACRVWPIAGDNGGDALFLGPIAVDSRARSGGIGGQLVAACLNASEGHTIILVGDLSFFGPFGFEVIDDPEITMPGPVDPKRFLWRRPGGLDRQQEGRQMKGRLIVPRATIQTS